MQMLPPSSRTAKPPHVSGENILKKLLNHPSVIDRDYLAEILQQDTLTYLDTSLSLKELNKAINQSSNGKASGTGSLPAELFKAEKPGTITTFHGILVSIWEEEIMSSDFRDATAVPIYKTKPAYWTTVATEAS